MIHHVTEDFLSYTKVYFVAHVRHLDLPTWNAAWPNKGPARLQTVLQSIASAHSRFLIMILHTQEWMWHDLEKHDRM